MPQMNAAVVMSFDEPPHYQPFDVPTPTTDDELLVEVVAAGLHPRVRGGAAGRHYTSTGALPMIPGVDAVARRADGRLIYFAADDHVLGTMAERAIADSRRAIELPDGIDAATVAAAMNPAMSSWVALRKRVQLQPGQSVLVLGATGNAGTMAIQVARLLGAGQVIGAGRDAARLEASSADLTVQLTDEIAVAAAALGEAVSGVDVVIDYLWGEPARLTMEALLTARSDRSIPLDWIQIGAITGPTLELPSVFLRSANLRIQGSGQGSVSPRVYRDELPSLVAEIAAGTIAVNPVTRPLSEVESVWTERVAPGERVVLVP